MRTAGWRIGGARVSAEWIWCQRLVDRSAVLLFPQGAYWYVYRMSSSAWSILGFGVSGG